MTPANIVSAALELNLDITEVRKAFNALTDPMMKHVELGQEESDGLAEVRDYLLPKLMSGEVTVGEAEHLVSEAM